LILWRIASGLLIPPFAYPAPVESTMGRQRWMKSPHGCRKIQRLFDLVEITSIRSRNMSKPRYFAAVGAGKNNRAACCRCGSINGHVQI
jgi:hypothetical protein